MTQHRLLTILLGATALVTATQIAGAADIPVKMSRAPATAAMAQVLPIYNWTGMYVGMHGGWATGTLDTDIPGASLDQDGWFLGAQVGYNWQGAFSNWVYGIELDSAWANIEGRETAVGGIITASVNSETQYIGSLRGRVGYAYGSWLPYVTGGLAWGQNEVKVSATVFGTTASISDDQTAFGWTIGAGLEWAFAPRWSAKVEYLYYDLGSATYFENIGGGLDADTSFQTIKIGLNYRL